MICITRDDDIAILQLSTHSQNCLRHCDLNTVGHLLDYPLNDLTQIRNMNIKCLHEIRQCMASIHDGSGSFRLVDQFVDPIKDAPMTAKYAVTLTNDSGTVVFDPHISELPLSVRSKNCLIKSGYTNVSQLIGITQDDLLHIQNMGQKSVAEVISFLKENTLLCSIENDEKLDSSNTIANELADFYGNSADFWQWKMVSLHNVHPSALGETFIYLLYESVDLRDTAKKSILKFIEKNNGIILKAALSTLMPKHMSNTTVLEELLLELENSGAIESDEERIRSIYPSITDFASEIQDERQREIIQKRLNGSTLEDIGREYGLTRERIRQVTLIALQKRPRLREDQYQYIYDTYDFSETDFCLAFEEPLETYRYLKMISNNAHKSRLPLEDILTDNTISPDIRKKAERAVYKNYITAEGVRILKRRSELVKYCVKSRCTAKTKYSDFLLLYHEMLNEFGLSEDTPLSLDSRTYENVLNKCDYVLWNQWRSFRYYDIPTRDYAELLDTLDLKQYENTELSTLKFVHDYPNLMAQYDIHDEYELHNLLKKIWPADDTSVTFNKMPTLSVGTSDHSDQVLSLLIQYAPISAEDLAQKYEESYGIKATTVLANYLRDFDDYYYNGIYRIDHQNLSPQQFKHMKSVLNKPFYLIADVKRLYKLIFPNESSGNINPYTLKTLGFRVLSGYIVKNTYTNAGEFFRSLLLSDDIIDARHFDYGITSTVGYSNELYDLRNKYQIIEFSPKQYINIRKLNQIGITISDFKAYQHAVAEFCRSGDFFTIYSLRQDGFVHPLDELGFDEWFYSSILLEDRIDFTFQRIGGARLFRYGAPKVTLGDLLAYLVEQSKKIDIYDLVEMLVSRYGIRLSKDKILEIISSTDLYYDKIMEAVYIDYDTYFEEI